MFNLGPIFATQVDNKVLHTEKQRVDLKLKAGIQKIIEVEEMGRRRGEGKRRRGDG